ncbi:hypothetical protein ABEW34_21560 [Paenibacillus algorifonticola]|uniref:hypothetical protein n=1 Tax=Paenibacillus algorifonticola TaxID=684063 RepID=UPI003D2BB91C
MLSLKIDYIKEMKKIYTINFSQLETLEWFLVITGSAGTVICTAALVYWVWKLIAFFWRVRLGHAPLNDKKFWGRMLVALLIIFLFMSSGLFLIAKGLVQVFIDLGWQV